jgi:acetyl-CoA C-acetyltransferase
MSTFREIVVVSAKRTPIGSFLGNLSSVTAPKLGSTAIKGILNEIKININKVDEVIMGNVLPAGSGQAPARQAALGAGLPNGVECLTINKVCGSGLKAIMLAMQTIQVGDASVIIAGGMENMSLTPYYLPKARTGYRMGPGKIIDGMIRDGLWDVYNDIHMGSCAELCARDRNFSREAQDEFAVQSYERAIDAMKNGRFYNEIVTVEVPQRKGDSLHIKEDEEPGRVKFEKISNLKPAFEKDGTITAANASKINDGAAAVLVMDKETAKSLKLKPLVRIIAQGSTAQAPEWFTTAPEKAISKVLEKSNLKAKDIDLWEINEAFAPVTMAAINDFNLDPRKVNVNGGAIALGHPIGASGARIFTTLVHALEQKNARYGLATLCIGGGEASAVIVERV